ncbi:unnamed protein product [Lota lota]
MLFMKPSSPGSSLHTARKQPDSGSPSLETYTIVPDTAMITSIPTNRRRVHTRVPGSKVIAVAGFEPQRERSNMALVSDREAQGV